MVASKKDHSRIVDKILGTIENILIQGVAGLVKRGTRFIICGLDVKFLDSNGVGRLASRLLKEEEEAQDLETEQQQPW